MTMNDDLASWGELPAKPAEMVWADFLDEVLAELEQGNDLNTATFGRSRPELAGQGETLARHAALVYQCAASVMEHSGLIDDALAAETVEMGRLKGRTVSEPLPNPFPGEYRIRQLLGEGSFGKVWLADDLNLGWQVALKTLKLRGETDEGTPVLAALRKEAKLLAAVRHPNIVQVHAWRQTGHEHYLVLQFVPGGSLAERVKAGPLTWQDAARYIADAAEGLLEVHARGIVHRDIKPANLLWDSARDEAMLTDFGVSSRLAEPGTVAGTPAFMPLEAFDGEIGPALDVYGLAATLFRLITGEVPFPGKGIPNLIYQIQQGLPAPDPRCRDMPEAIERVIRSGLASDAGQRPSLKDFVEKLRASLNRLLADAMVPDADPKQKNPVNMKLVVSREITTNVYQPVALSKPKTTGMVRDMKKIPRQPEQVSLQTGDRVRIEVVADQPGYMTVFNVGPTGNLNLLYPDEPGGTLLPMLEANQTLHVLDVEMTPPAGPERLFAVWSRVPFTSQWTKLATQIQDHHINYSQSYQATRDMKRLKDTLQQVDSESLQSVVLALVHSAH